MKKGTRRNQDKWYLTSSSAFVLRKLLLLLEDGDAKSRVAFWRSMGINHRSVPVRKRWFRKATDSLGECSGKVLLMLTKQWKADFAAKRNRLVASRRRHLERERRDRRTARSLPVNLAESVNRINIISKTAGLEAVQYIPPIKFTNFGPCGEATYKHTFSYDEPGMESYYNLGTRLAMRGIECLASEWIRAHANDEDLSYERDSKT